MPDALELIQAANDGILLAVLKDLVPDCVKKCLEEVDASNYSKFQNRAQF